MINHKVSVIILNYNGRTKLRDLLDKAIESALNQSYPNIEVVFADNGSTDNSADYVRERFGGAVKVVRFGRNYGFCMGNNLSVKYIDKDSRYILFQNPDAILSRDYVSVLVDFMGRNKNVAAVQGLQVALDGSYAYCGGFVDSFGRGVELTLTPSMARLLSEPVDVYWVSGSAMLIRRRLFELVGGFPSEFFLYHDEIDLCSRLRYLGFRCVCVPRVAYYHVRGGIVGSNVINWVSWYFTYRNRLLTTIRYMPINYLIRSIMLGLPVEFAVNALKSFRDRVRIVLQLRMFSYIMRSLSKELRIRMSYVGEGNLSNVAKYIVSIPSPLTKEEYTQGMIIRDIIRAR